MITHWANFTIGVSIITLLVLIFWFNHKYVEKPEIQNSDSTGNTEGVKLWTSLDN